MPLSAIQEIGSAIWKILSNPRIAATGSLASILALVYTFSPLSSRETRQLVVFEESGYVKIVDAKRPSELTVTYKGEQIEDTIVARRIAFWNNSFRPIRSTNVLRPLRLRLKATEGQILETSLSKISRPETGISIKPVKDGEIELSWDILEKGDGASVQIIFKTTDWVTISYSGTIEGQGDPISARELVRFSSIGESLLIVFILSVLLGCIWLLAILSDVSFEFIKQPRWRRVLRGAVYACCIILGIICIISIAESDATIAFLLPDEPPFGF